MVYFGHYYTAHVFIHNKSGRCFHSKILGHIWEKASPADILASFLLGSITVYLGEKGIISFFGLEPIYLALIVSGISFYVFSKLYSEQYEHRDL